MRVAVIGAGRAGTAIAVLLNRAGHRIVGVAGGDQTKARASEHLPGVPVVEPVEAAAAADLVLIATPDDAIDTTVRTLAGATAVRAGSWVAHLSGSLGLDVLEPMRSSGGRRLAIHPLQTFPDVGSALERLPGCAIAVTADDEEGYRFGEGLAADLQGRPFRLADDRRPLYHAAAVFASNYLVVLSAVAETLFAAAGVPDPAAAMAPLRRATLDNVERLGPARALTGPVARGDAGTIRLHLETLKQHAPDVVPAYVAMARATIDLAERAGRLEANARAEVEDVLAAWS
jgi:predicted short-subunit dehydrogenase-like oxidoreductase (DUF2520 family)